MRPRVIHIAVPGCPLEEEAAVESVESSFAHPSVRTTTGALPYSRIKADAMIDVLWAYIRRIREYGNEIEPRILFILVMLGGGTWVFLEVADSVLEGETRSVDEMLLLAMRTPGDVSDPLGPPWIEEMARDVTALGGIAVLVFVTLATLVYFLLMDKRLNAVFVAGAVVGGSLLSMLFKAGFDRPRPTLVPHESHVYSASFPSGHSMMSAVVYLTLGVLLARLHERSGIKGYFLGLALLLTGAIGLSRVYLGVHWPTDVMAGWAAGAVWAMACWGTALWLQRREGGSDTASGRKKRS